MYTLKTLQLIPFVCMVCPLIIAELNQKSECGLPNGISSRIFGGTEVSPHSYPWMAQVTVRTRVFFGLTVRQPCGGALIHSQFILTAGHCLDKARKKNVEVFLGHHMTKDDTYLAHKPEIDHIIVHEKYRSILGRIPFVDIALVKLTIPVEFNYNIRPICLPPPADPEAHVNKTVIVAGWGKVGESDPTSLELRHVDVMVYPIEKCYALLGHLIEENALCAAKPGKDACTGDSGGPLMYLNEAGRFEQVGIVSWGFGCGRTNEPGVYTRVADFLPWIEGHIYSPESPVYTGGCGVLGEILEGDDIPDVYPWLASIAWDGNHHCTGTVISDSLIVTAAHCVVDDKFANRTLDSVILGRNDKGNVDGNSLVFTSSDIESIVVHEKYLFSYYSPSVYDIALIRLEEKIVFNKHIRPICLPSTGNLTAYDRKEVNFAGWKLVDHSMAVNHLHQMVLSREESMETKAGKYLKPQYIFAEPGGDMKCDGDRGGPLMYENVKNVYELIGLSSGGFNCSTDFPNVFIRVSEFLEWIHEHNMGKNDEEISINNESTNTTKPTKTTVPTTSNVPSSTIKPTETTVPTISTDPTNTTKPTKTKYPTTSNVPTNTTKPTKTTVPTTSTVPTNTTKPTKAAVPTTSTVPTNTTKPTKTAVPTTSTVATNTTKPRKTTVPTISTDPTNTTKPRKTTVPTTSNVPTNTIKPTETTVPTSSTVSTNTTKLLDTTIPSTLTVPTSTTKPTETTITTSSTVSTNTTKPTVHTIKKNSRNRKIETVSTIKSFLTITIKPTETIFPTMSTEPTLPNTLSCLTATAMSTVPAQPTVTTFSEKPAVATVSHKNIIRLKPRSHHPHKIFNAHYTINVHNSHKTFTFHNSDSSKDSQEINFVHYNAGTFYKTIRETEPTIPKIPTNPSKLAKRTTSVVPKKRPRKRTQKTKKTTTEPTNPTISTISTEITIPNE